MRAFEEVRAEITKRLTQQQAAQLAARQGREMLAKLKGGGEVSGLTWGTPNLLSRENSQGYAGPVLAEVFKADASKLPAYAGLENAQGGFVLLKITRVVDAGAVDAAKRKSASEELRKLMGQAELDAYVASLKLKSDVKVQQDQLEKKQ